LQGTITSQTRYPFVTSLCTLKVSTSPAGIKYKFGIQVPKGIKHAIDLDKKNGNQLWQEAIKTELKQLTDYQTFIVLDSGEDIPTGY
jgi:hypothetical protein